MGGGTVAAVDDAAIVLPAARARASRSCSARAFASFAARLTLAGRLLFTVIGRLSAAATHPAAGLARVSGSISTRKRCPWCTFDTSLMRARISTAELVGEDLCNERPRP